MRSLGVKKLCFSDYIYCVKFFFFAVHSGPLPELPAIMLSRQNMIMLPRIQNNK